jgi:hypothetical protein
MAVSSYQQMTGRYALVLLRSWPPVQLGIALAMQKRNIGYLEDKMMFDGSFLETKLETTAAFHGKIKWIAMHSSAP